MITTPPALVVDDGDVVSVRARDESGGFGILKGHADFLTALTISVISWTTSDGGERFAAVRRGVLRVRGGDEVSIATREAVTDTSLDHLEQVILTRFREFADAEREARTDSLKLQMRAIKQIVKYLRPGQPSEFSM